ncbi:MAG: diaminopimelate epimerase, partial [Clostridiales bacterium]|nr:diaminopimelate epimerase [Clostridiales bacterium]
MKFVKMQGTGNDYIYVNCLNEQLENPEKAAVRLSDRHFGIGSDGLILICKSGDADFRMDMYNVDGSRAEMCGNGIRCLGKYVYDHGLTEKELVTVETLSGIKTLKLITEGGKCCSVIVDMGIPELLADIIPVIWKSNSVINRELTIEDEVYKITCVSMGNPHVIIFVEDVDKIDIERLGPLFENNAIFPNRVNTEFVQVMDSGRLKMRVWERGSGETLACGTGACAAVVAAV